MNFAPGHVESRLTAFLDRELSNRSARRVARHLETCPACGEAARSIERARLVARFVPEFPMPPGIGMRLEARLFGEPAPALPARRRVYSMALGAAAAAVVLIVVVARPRPDPLSRPRRISAAPEGIASFDQTALRLHRERLEGSLSFEICDSSRRAVSDWVCREAGLDLPRPPISLGNASASARECAAIVPEAGRRIAVVAMEVGRRPVTLLTTRVLRVSPGDTRTEGLVYTRKDAATGLEVESWVSGGQAYAAVSQGND